MKRILSVLFVVVIALNPYCLKASADCRGLSLAFISSTPNSLSSSGAESDTLSTETEASLLFQNDLLTQFGNLIQETLEYDGQILKLYPVFENKISAWESFIISCSYEVCALKEQYNLQDISVENCGTYFSCALEQNELYEGMSQVVAFLDVFKTYAKNERIKAIILENPLPDDEVRMKLALLLPYGNPFQALVQENTRSWSTTDAVSYAEQYAVVPNILSYTYMPTGDCANFASQIRHAGGINMSYVWHYYSSSDYTDTWTYADDFIKRLTPRHAASHDFRTLTIYAHVGDFIAYDATGNGDYDHVGFVTQRDTYSYSYEVIKNGVSLGFINYFNMKIAQHTTNYHRWVAANNNNWDAMYFTNSSCMFIAVQA